MSHHSNEIMIPLEMASQIQQVPIPVPFIPPMEQQHSPVTYEAVTDHQPIPVVDPVTKEVVTIVGRDFNQNQMPNVRMTIEPEIIQQQQHPSQIQIESISFQQNIIEENKIEEVSIQLEPGAVQIETPSINSNHVVVDEAPPVIPNIPDGTMVHTTITKSMSWTNHHQQQQQHHNHHKPNQHQQHQHNYNKKSTASVAVTATPTPSNGKSFTPSTKHQQTASTTTTPSPQVKNHGAMKTPSSPVGVQNNSSTKGTTTSTSTASATAIPQQLQEPKKPHKSQGPLVFTPPITNPQPQNSNAQQSWASLFNASPAAPTNYTTTSTTPVVPPTQNNVNNNSSSGSSNNNNHPALPTTIPQQTSANNATTTTTTPIPTKPVAKVAPYESGAVSQPSPVVSQNQPQTLNNHTSSSFSTNPGALSYSAASTQSLSPAYSGGGAQNNHMKPKPHNSVASTINNKSAASSTTTTTTVNNKNQSSNFCGDEWSIKLAKFLTKYKTDFNAVSLKPRGLMNKSNYCYINSILQALIGCPPFYNLLKNLPKQPTALQTEVKTPTLNAM